MLSSLQIENVAVIQKANVHFEKGLNVLTGETGAGKSILIDSINAILGNRTSKDLVRTGAAKAVIRAAFEDVPPAVLDSLEKAGYERSEALLLSREITAEGKSTCRINGMPATAAVLRELCGVQRDTKPERLLVASFDTTVHSVYEFGPMDEVPYQLRLDGGGGTAFDDALRWAEQQGAEAIVVLTDLQGSARYQPSVPVLWACRMAGVTGPFGTTIHVEV